MTSPFAQQTPACWSWPVPPRGTYEEVVAAEMAKGFSRNVVEMYLSASSDPVGLSVFVSFHAERCAICGQQPLRLIDDHCHDTGLIRGYLCQSCNVREGVSWRDDPEHDVIFQRYRERPPAVRVAFRMFYTGRGWEHGWWKNEQRGRLLTGNPDWHPEIQLVEGGSL